MNSKGADPTAAAVSTHGKRKFGESTSPSASVYKIYPILYDVDPSEVRNQRGSYEVAVSLHEKKFHKGTVQRWRDTLTVVGGLKGLELKMETDGPEGELVTQVEKVVRELKNTHIPEMDNPIKELMGLLRVDFDYVWIIGIHGRGCLGKTTIAKVIYIQLCWNFVCLAYRKGVCLVSMMLITEGV